MKKYVSILMVLCGLLMMTGTAWSLTMNDVKSLDSLVASASLGNSGDATELSWVNSVLGTSYTAMDKYEIMSWSVVTDAANVYAIDFATDNPAYFFIKVGAQNGETDHYLYKNLESLNYGVISLQATGVDIKNIGKLSHIGEMGNVTVPEPSILILLGMGLLGIAGIRRKK